jgi:hypothetical protein
MNAMAFLMEMKWFSGQLLVVAAPRPVTAFVPVRTRRVLFLRFYELNTLVANLHKPSAVWENTKTKGLAMTFRRVK